MTRARRIGVTQRVEVLSQRGERRDTVDQAWVPLLEGLGFVPVLLSNRHRDPAGYTTSLELDALLLSGGNDIADQGESTSVAPERDETERKLLRWAAQRMVPVLGVCRGFQMMNVHLGGRLVRAQGHVGTVHATRALCDDGRLPAGVNSSHDWAITRETLAGELDPLAVAEDDTIEFAHHRRLPWLGIMWHPERKIAEPDFHRALVAGALNGHPVGVTP